MLSSMLLVPAGSATLGTESLAEGSWGQLPAAPQEPRAVCTTEAALLGGKAVCWPPPPCPRLIAAVSGPVSLLVPGCGPAEALALGTHSASGVWGR